MNGKISVKVLGLIIALFMIVASGLYMYYYYNVYSNRETITTRPPPPSVPPSFIVVEKKGEMYKILGSTYQGPGAGNNLKDVLVQVQKSAGSFPSPFDKVAEIIQKKMWEGGLVVDVDEYLKESTRKYYVDSKLFWDVMTGKVESTVFSLNYMMIRLYMQGKPFVAVFKDGHLDVKFFSNGREQLSYLLQLSHGKTVVLYLYLTSIPGMTPRYKLYIYYENLAKRYGDRYYFVVAGYSKELISWIGKEVCKRIGHEYGLMWPIYVVDKGGIKGYFDDGTLEEFGNIPRMGPIGDYYDLGRYLGG